MIGTALLLTLAYVAVAALLLNLNLATRHSVWVKAIAIVLVSALYLGSWHGYRGLLGWPTWEPTPETFRVLWISIEEPEKATARPGSIYYWLRELDPAGFAVGTPRVHAVPWDEAAAEQAQQALDRLNEGERLNGRRSRNLMIPSKGSLQEENESDRGTFSAGQQEGAPEFEFVAVPAPSLPAKAAPEMAN